MTLLKRFPIILTVIFVIATTSYAEIQTYTHTVKQVFGGAQSPDDARIAAGILKVEIVSQKNYASENGFGVIIVTKMDVDLSVFEVRVNKMLHDRSIIDKYQATEERNNELLAKIATLEEENKKLKELLEQERKQGEKKIKEEFHKTAKALTADQWAKKVIALLEGIKSPKEFDSVLALKYMNEYFKLDPESHLGFMLRGIVYATARKNEEALADLNKAIELKKSNFRSYFARGFGYFMMAKLEESIADYNRAIEIKPNFYNAYNNMGDTYNRIKKYGKAIADYSKE